MRKLTLLLAAGLLAFAGAGCDLLRLPGGDAHSGPDNVPGDSAEEIPFMMSTEQPMESVPGLPADPTPEVPPPVY